MPISRIFHRHPLLALAAGAAAGILLDGCVVNRLVSPDCGVGTVLWVGSFLIVAAALRKMPVDIRWIAAGSLLMPVAAMRHRAVTASYDDASILQIVSETSAPAVIDGTVDRPVVLRRHPLAGQVSRRDQSPWQTQLEIRIRSARVGGSQRSVRGRALVVADGKLDDFLPGDEIRVFGWASRFLPSSNPGATDSRDVYRRRNLHVRINVGCAEQLVRTKAASSARFRNPTTPLYRHVAKVARRGRDILLRHTDASSGPLAVALVIGQRDFVDQQTRDALLVTGTAHLLSVSGLHLAIIVILASVLATLLHLPVCPRIVFVFAICVLYTAITGARPPVLRACILVSAFMFSRLVRRPVQPLNSLALAAIALLLYNPELLFSVGVQLSFLAVTTLLMCGRRGGSSANERVSARERQLDELVLGARPAWYRTLRFAGVGLGQMIWFSGCVTAISIPLVWYHFNVISPVSVVTNVVLWPLLFVSLAAGVTTVLTGWISDPLAAVPGEICHTTVLAMREVIDAATSMPWGHTWLPSPPAIWVMIFYVILLMSVWWRPDSGGFRLRCVWIMLWLMIAVFLATRPTELPQGSIEATFVDVGHGTCAVLRLSDEDVWLYDCGRLGNDSGHCRAIEATLWSMGVTRLSGIVLSHADSDHYNAIPGITRRFGVGRIVTPPGMLHEDEPGLAETRRAIAAAGIRVDELAAGDVIESGRHRFSILHPPPQRLDGNDNANSLVLRIDHGGKSLILPGDLEPPGTDLLIRQRRPPPGGVLMAPHHGSLRMDAAKVLQWARPRETIVSGGRRATRPEVREMLSAAGSGVHVTAAQGAIRVRINRAGSIETDAWLDSPWPNRGQPDD